MKKQAAQLFAKTIPCGGLEIDDAYDARQSA
jgi:hypothetical protein